MDPRKAACPNPDCPLQGQTGAGSIRLHSKKEKRFRCRKCNKTFAATTGTVFYRRRYDEQTITCVVTLLAYGCPVQAICRAFSLDERTVCAWHEAASRHCQRLHEQVIESSQMDLGHVQADELRIKAQGHVVWMALALCVTTRLWLGGEVSTTREKAMVCALALKVRACALCRPILVVFDGFSAYIDAFKKAFRSPRHTGKRGRPRLVRWPAVILGRVIKSRRGRRLERLEREVLPRAKAIIAPGEVDLDAEGLAERLLEKSRGGEVLNTAYIERFNGTMRSRIAALARRTRALARLPQTLSAGMYLAGCVYNFCSEHRSLAVEFIVVGPRGERRRWAGRTPAMAASLTDHCWSVGELLNYRFTTESQHHG
jgi:transposase-like protein/IS1 family transposase